jgi:hypothetical protein
MWKVAANVLNKQSPTADKRRSYILGLGVELTTPHRKEISLLENPLTNLRQMCPERYSILGPTE